MRIHTLNNYVLIPKHEDRATLYELGEEKKQESESFVIIPYKNPRTKTPAARFYPVKNKSEILLPPLTIPSSSIELKSRTGKHRYIETVKKLKQHIQRGNIYEINYCMEFFSEKADIDPLNAFVKLNELARAPYAMLFKYGNEFIISASPELFLKKEGNRISSKPIKGTIKRGNDKAEDEALKDYLHHSHKERTENVMAVDVARNDLSRFAEKGTVQVNKLYNIETFETVHQMVSTVSCDLAPGTRFEDIVQATFPMASMTGAPKQKAMDLIDEFEDFERENYSGAMGFMAADGDFTLSVIIRSIFYNQDSKHLSIAVGGAITYLSEPEKEYEECLLKANALLKALNARIAE